MCCRTTVVGGYHKPGNCTITVTTVVQNFGRLSCSITVCTTYGIYEYYGTVTHTTQAFMNVHNGLHNRSVW